MKDILGRSKASRVSSVCVEPDKSGIFRAILAYKRVSNRDIGDSRQVSVKMNYGSCRSEQILEV